MSERLKDQDRVKSGETLDIGGRNVRVTSGVGYRKVGNRDTEYSVAIDYVTDDKKAVALVPGKIVSVHAQPKSGSSFDVAKGNYTEEQFKEASKGFSPNEGKAGGFYVTVQNDDGTYSRYMHLSPITKEEAQGLVGKKLGRGDVIYDYSKLTGSGTAPHVKVRVFTDLDKPSTETALDPTPYLRGQFSGYTTDPHDSETYIGASTGFTVYKGADVVTGNMYSNFAKDIEKEKIKEKKAKTDEERAELEKKKQEDKEKKEGQKRQQSFLNEVTSNREQRQQRRASQPEPSPYAKEAGKVAEIDIQSQLPNMPNIWQEFDFSQKEDVKFQEGGLASQFLERAKKAQQRDPERFAEETRNLQMKKFAKDMAEANVPKTRAEADAMIESGQLKVETIAQKQAREKREAEAREQQRVAALKAYEQRVNTPGYNAWTGLPGESWKDMLAAEAAPLAAQFRVSQGDNFFDDYINPAAWVGSMAKDLGESPKRAQQEDSYLPYLTSIGMPVLGGALAGAGTKNTGQFVNNVVNPLAGMNPLKSKQLPGSSNAASSVDDVGRGFKSEIDWGKEYFQKILDKSDELIKLYEKEKITWSEFLTKEKEYKKELAKELGLKESLGRGNYGEVYSLANNPSKAIKVGEPFGGKWTPEIIESMKSVKQNANIAIPEQVQYFELPSRYNSYNKTREVLTMPNLNQTNAVKLELTKRDRYAYFLKQARQLRDKGIILDVNNPSNFKFNPDKGVFDIYDINPGSFNPSYYMNWVRDNTKENLLNSVFFKYGGKIGNDGMFDMTNPNIYKALFPAAVATGVASQEYQTGGAIELKLTPEEIEWYKSQGYNVEVPKGKYQPGGTVKPYITSNPNDPRIKAYEDSLANYRTTEQLKSAIESARGNLSDPRYLKALKDNYRVGYGTSGTTTDEYRGVQMFDFPKPKQEVILRKEYKPNMDTDVAAFMKTMGMNNSYEQRKKMFLERFPDETYSGTAPQNIKLLKTIKAEMQSVQEQPDEVVPQEVYPEKEMDTLPTDGPKTFDIQEWRQEWVKVPNSPTGGYWKKVPAGSTKYLKGFEDGGLFQGVEVDPMGLWNGKRPVVVPSNEITMKGVNYDVLGISDEGDRKIMKPGRKYKFKGSKVLEIPLK